MVSCDLCSISPTLVDDLAATADALVARAPGLDPAKIVLNATHTHAGPCYEDGRFVVPETGGAMQPFEGGCLAWDPDRTRDVWVEPTA